MIFKDTPLKMELQLIMLGIAYAFQCPVFNSIPFLYFRSDLECNISGIWQQCQEQDICDKLYDFRYVNKQGVESITMDYGLVCEKRLTEASMMSIGFFGQVAAYLIAVFTEIPKNQKTNILFACLLFEGAILFSTSFIKGNITWLIIVLFVWNFIFSYLYSQIFAFINDMYTTSIKDLSVNFISLSWTLCSLFYTIFSQFDGRWIDHVAYFSGATIMISSIFFFIFSSPPSQSDPLLEPYNNYNRLSFQQGISDKEIAIDQQKNFINDFIQKFKSLIQNKKYLANGIIFVVAYSFYQISFSTPFIAFNTLGGNVQFNVLISVFFDVGGSFIALYLMSIYDPLYLQLRNTFIMGLIQTLTYFTPVSSYWIQMPVLLMTKLCTRLAFTTLLTLLNFVLPYQFNQLIFNISNVFAILFSILLPFFRFYMENNNISIFCGAGILNLILLVFLSQFKIIDENSDIKMARQSKDFKRSSIAPMIRNSDNIMEDMLRKSSILTPQAALVLLDKQGVMQEKQYMIQNRHSELETINEN